MTHAQTLMSVRRVLIVVMAMPSVQTLRETILVLVETVSLEMVLLVPVSMHAHSHTHTTTYSGTSESGHFWNQSKVSIIEVF